MSLLIFSHVGDIHADCVARVLRKHGEQCRIFRCDEYPVSSTITFDLEADEPVLRGPDIDARLGSFNVVWNRRGWSPVFDPQLDEKDRDLVSPICRRYCDEMRRASPPANQTWVNGRAAQLAMRSKAVQLRLAKRIGFSVPEAVITNDPEVARRFVSRPGEFVVKGLAPMHWDEADRNVFLPTTRIGAADLEEDISIQSCPMIYQRYVAKSYEFRVVKCGDDILWVKIHSQMAGEYDADWRQVSVRELRPEAVEPPLGADAMIREFCRQADLVHASFDLAVTPENSLVFFEVNEQGQSLWIEQLNEDIRMLSMLSRMLWRAGDDKPVPWADRDIKLTDFADTDSA